MEFLKNINFDGDDGVNRNMINDFVRNQFYENIFINNVKDQHCVDIGFGTGLLSMLALKHGAKTVVAYETNQHRYQLGKHIIDHLGYGNKIHLINQRFTHDDFQQYPNVTTVFSETVNGNLWQEGLFNSLPRTPRLNFLPNKYFLEIYACEIPLVFGKGLLQLRANQGFTPGIDLEDQFVKLINQLGFPAHQDEIFKDLDELTAVDPGQDTEWGWIPYLRLCVNNGVLVGGYSVDANQVEIDFVNLPTKKHIDFDQQSISFVVDTKKYQDKCVLLVPRVGMSHNHHRLYLDTGHWGPTQYPVILNRPRSNIVVEHDLFTGDINFNLD
jgi:hypothetical protein